MPTHDPARKRRAFRRVPRKRKVFVEASPRAESEHTCARAMYDYGKDVVQPPVCEQACTGPMLLGSLKDLAYLVWESDYASLFELEQLALEESGRLMTAAALLKAVPEKSTYAQKGRSKIDKTKDDALRAMHLAVMAMRQANQQKHAFSVCIRSLAALARRTPSAEWRRQVKERELLDRIDWRKHDTF